MRYQLECVKKFTTSKFKILEYWKKYRYLDEICAICKIENIMKILEFGCGISTVLHFVKGERYGINPLANEYKKIYSYPAGINIKKAFGEDITFKEESFDVVFRSNALDHVSDSQKTVNEIHRVLKPRGYFVLIVEVFKKKPRELSHTLTVLQNR